MTDKQPNDSNAGVTKLLLAIETDRRTDAGRIRSATEFRSHFFSYLEESATDSLFHRMPNEVRGPIVAAWGIRGAKMALKDTDEKIRAVIHDAFLAGDLDDAAFEDGVGAHMVVAWAEPPTLWSFWRGGKHTKRSINACLVGAYELGLFDAKWFLESVQKGPKLGTDALADTLSKQDLTDWLRAVHEKGDGSPKGLLEALGWDKLVEKTPDAVLLQTIDALAGKIGLVPKKEEPKPEPAPVPEAVLIPEAPDLGAWQLDVTKSATLPTGETPGFLRNDTKGVSPKADAVADPGAPAPAAEEAGSGPTAGSPDDRIEVVETNPPPSLEVGEVEIETDAGEDGEFIEPDPPTLPPPSKEALAPGEQVVETGHGPTVVDWGEHAPNPSRSLQEEANRLAFEGRGPTPLSRVFDSLGQKKPPRKGR